MLNIYQLKKNKQHHVLLIATCATMIPNIFQA